MASALDVAEYILQKKGEMTTIKLQKLVYYSQAWSLVWDGKPLFSEEIQAWANGPVVVDLFYVHKGMYSVSTIPGGDIKQLSPTESETIDAVLSHYGDKSPHWLIELSHREDPWREARGTCADGEPCNNVITNAMMANYYSGL